MKFRNKFIFISGIISIVIILLIAAHFILYYQGNKFTFLLFGQPVIKLGWDAVNIYPKELENAYNIKKVDGSNVRIAKYSHDVLFESAKEGVITAKSIDSGKVKYFQWAPTSGYVCTDKTTGAVIVDNQPVDPKKQLANYIFVSYGDSFRGVTGGYGLGLLYNDANFGDPIKIYTTTADGPEVLQAVLFTSNDRCNSIGYNNE